ncbi:MAG: radical SAM protein [Peptococcaceae bacterium]|jgi:radical SAM protein with 4Fe4S-binding SPASM domain|nr:radical SAM protein [Peptococcaceae bacterium]
MLTGTKNFLRKYQNIISAKKWFKNRPLECTLGPKTALPYPKVIEPVNNRIPDFPSYIALEITNACNLQCKHCNYRFGLEHYTRDRGFITDDLVLKVFEEISEYKIPILMNYDGEPLIHKDFIRYLRLATEMGINTYFNTNGTMFTKEFADELVGFYRGSVFFSIDGNKNWFEKIRVPAKYDDVVKNLKYFINANNEAGSPITIGVSLCNLGQTIEERRAFYEEWLPQVNYISMGEVNDKNGTIISDTMTKVELKKRPVCIVPWQTCGITYNGDVVPCSIYITRANTTNMILGNIQDQTIKEIWLGKNYRQFRNMHLKNKIKETFCETCQRWYSQISFPDVIYGDVKVIRNGFWTTYTNMNKGELNFNKSKV